ncbi:hypothetical protein [Serratia marcescens]|nr:hypothetical protein [Serratia marcescens]
MRDILFYILTILIIAAIAVTFVFIGFTTGIYEHHRAVPTTVTSNKK